MSLLPKPFDLTWPLTEDAVANLEIMLQELYRDLSDGVLYPVTVPKGGTNITAYVIGDLLYASATNVLSRLADVATGNVLLSGGVGAAPSWGKVDLVAHITGILPVANGGTNISSYTIGDLLYASAVGVLSKLAAGTSGYVLTSGGPGVAPSWSAPASSGIGGLLTNGDSINPELMFDSFGDVITTTV